MSLDVATMPLRTDHVVTRVADLAERFRSRTAITEAERSIPHESIVELVDAGVARVLVPAEYGGLDLGVRDAVDITIAAAKGCASTGWIAWLMMHVPHVVAMFPAEAQDAVWAAGPDVVTAGSHLGMTVAVTPGGYRISGRGAFTSGVNNADWVYVGGFEPAGSGPPQLRYFLIDKRQYTIEDTWDTIGMRGTGSNTVVVEDLFVPEGFTLSHADAREGTSPGSLLNASPVLRLPWVAKGYLGFIANILGAAQAAQEEVVAAVAKKRGPGGGARRRERGRADGGRVGCGEAGGCLHAAERACRPQRRRRRDLARGTDPPDGCEHGDRHARARRDRQVAGTRRHVRLWLRGSRSAVVARHPLRRRTRQPEQARAERALRPRVAGHSGEDARNVLLMVPSHRRLLAPCWLRSHGRVVEVI